jgi:hypothetical protein
MNNSKKLTRPLVSVVMMTFLLSGAGCGTSRVIGKTYTDENGYYCLHPETLKSINVAIKNAPKKKVVVNAI